MKSLIVCSLFLLLPMSASAHLYKSVSSSGKVTYADRPSDERYSNVLVMRAAGLETADAGDGPAALSVGRSVRAGATVAGPVIVSSAPRVSGDKLERVDIEIKADGRMVIAKGIALPAGHTAAGIKPSR